MDRRIKRRLRKAHALADAPQEIIPQHLLSPHGAEGLFQEVSQAVEAGAPPQIGADGAKTQRGQPLAGVQALVGIIEVGDDFLDAALHPGELSVEALLAGLELAKSRAVKVIRALQRGDATGEKRVLDGLRSLRQVRSDAKAAEGLAEQGPGLKPQVFAEALGIAHDTVLVQ